MSRQENYQQSVDKIKNTLRRRGCCVDVAAAAAAAAWLAARVARLVPPLLLLASLRFRCRYGCSLLAIFAARNLGILGLLWFRPRLRLRPAVRLIPSVRAFPLMPRLMMLLLLSFSLLDLLLALQPLLLHSLEALHRSDRFLLLLHTPTRRTKNIRILQTRATLAC